MSNVQPYKIYPIQCFFFYFFLMEMNSKISSFRNESVKSVIFFCLQMELEMEVDVYEANYSDHDEVSKKMYK
jgi:hypothetical protein